MKITPIVSHSRLSRYALAAGAVVAAGSASRLAGQIVYFDNTHSFSGSTAWDIDGDGNMDFTLSHTSFFTSSGFHIRNVQFANYGTGPYPGAHHNFNGLAAPGHYGVTPLTAGGLIGANLYFGPALLQHRFVTNQGAVTTPMAAGTQYIAFRFLTAGTVLHYGWAEITVTPDVGDVLTVNAWAYNSVANATILAGQTTAIPEPANAVAGLGLLALGAAGVACYKRRKAATKESV